MRSVTGLEVGIKNQQVRQRYGKIVNLNPIVEVFLSELNQAVEERFSPLVLT